MAAPTLDELQVTLDCIPGRIILSTSFGVHLLLGVATTWAVPAGAGHASSLTFMSPCCRDSVATRRCGACGEPLDGIYAHQLITREGHLNYSPIAEVVGMANLDPLARTIVNGRLESWLELIIGEDSLVWPRNVQSTFPLMEL